MGEQNKKKNVKHFPTSKTTIINTFCATFEVYLATDAHFKLTQYWGANGRMVSPVPLHEPAESVSLTPGGPEDGTGLGLGSVQYGQGGGNISFAM